MQNLENCVPKTITSMGKFTHIFNLKPIFDFLPIFNAHQLQAQRYKYEGMSREMDSSIVENEKEFKNCITMEIIDLTCSKMRVVKINGDGIHLCGNRCVKRSRVITQTILDMIIQTDSFIQHVANGSFDDHPFFDTIRPIIESIMGGELQNPSKLHALREVCEQVCETGLWIKTERLPEIKYLKTVMVNFTYPPYGVLKSKSMKKSEFIARLFETIKRPELEHHFQVVYDSVLAPMDWSGSIPVRLIHKEDQSTQLFTIQLRKGTIIHSGPNITAMQRGVNDLVRVLNIISSH
jgi:hypothetical protein